MKLRSTIDGVKTLGGEAQQKGGGGGSVPLRPEIELVLVQPVAPGVYVCG